MNGGYVLIDLGGLDLSVSTKQTIPGLHARIVTASETNKFAIADNVIGGSPLPAIITASGGNIILTAPGYVISVGADDGATVTPGGGGSVKKKPELSNITYTGKEAGIVSITPAFDPGTSVYTVQFDSSSGTDTVTVTAESGVTIVMDDGNASPISGVGTLTFNMSADNMLRPYVVTLSNADGDNAYVFNSKFN